MAVRIDSPVPAPGTVGIVSLDTTLTDTAYRAWVGSTLDEYTSNVTSSAGVVTLTFEKNGGGDIRAVFSTATITIDCTPALTIALTAGSDTAPTLNYVYILASAPTVLTKSLVGFPTTEEFISVGQFLVQSAATVATYGLFSANQINNEVIDSPLNGHISDINNWIRAQPATWTSGTQITPTLNAGASPDTLTIAVSAGYILQLHQRTFGAFDSSIAGTANSNTFFVRNRIGFEYEAGKDLFNFKYTSANLAANNNDRISWVVWGASSKTTGDQKIFINLPSGYYTSNSTAIADDSRYTDYSIPAAYIGSGFLIAKLTYRYNNTGGGTLTLVENVDLRGQFPSLFAGGTAIATTEFLDSEFLIRDDLDPARQLDFQLAASTAGFRTTLATSNTADRTLTFPDISGTLITTADTATVSNTMIAGTIPANKGGTGFNTYAVGDILYANTTTTLSKLLIGATNRFLQVIAGIPTWSAYTLPSVIGALGTFLRSDGTNLVASTSTIPDTFTTGDTVIATATNTLGVVAGAADGKLYQAKGIGVAPAYTTATYPSIATSTGTILRADGTNIVATTATYPATTTANQILYSSATDVIGQITTAATSALVTNSSSVPSLTSGTIANRLLRTDGTTISFAQAALTTDISGVLPIANGGTNQSAALTAGSILFSSGTAVTQDNANLFFDNTNNRLGLGVTTPQARLDVSSAAGADGFELQRWKYSDTFSLRLKHDVAFLDVGFSFDLFNNATLHSNVLSIRNGRVGVGTSTPGARLHVSPAASTGAVVADFRITTASNTALTASTERLTMDINPDAQQWATGALATQRFSLLRQPSISFVGASTVTNVATLAIAGAPLKSTNATVTNTHALIVEAGAVSTATNSYGLTINAQTGATTNYAAQFIGGNVGIGLAAPTADLHIYKASGIAQTITQSNTVTLQVQTNSAGSGLGNIGTTSAHDLQIISNNTIFMRLVGGFYTELYMDMIGSGRSLGTLAIPFSSVHSEDFYISNGIGQSIRHGAGVIASSYTINWPSSQGGAGTFPKNDGSGNLTWTTGAVYNDNWAFCGAVNGVGGSVTSVAGISDTTNDSGVTMPTAGTVKYITIVVDTARTNGTCIAKWLKNGVVQAGTVTIDGTNTTSHRNTAVNIAYAAGDVLRMQTVTSGFTPSGADATVAIFCKDS